MLFVEHDMDVVHDISDWVVVMAEGRSSPRARRRRSARNQAVIDAYLGAHHDATSRDRRTRSAPADGGPSAWRRTDEAPRVDGDRRRRPSPCSSIRRPGRRLRPRGQHPQRLRPDAAPGRVRRDHRPERRRQVDVAQGRVRAGPGARAARSACDGEDITGRKAHELVARGRRLRPADQQRVPERSPSTENLEMGVLPAAGRVQRAHRVRDRAVPPARRARRPAGRIAVGRRAPDGGHGPGADARAEGAAARRALGRALARRCRTRCSSRAEQINDDRRGDPDGRAERPPLPPGLRPRATCSTRAATPTPAPGASCSTTPRSSSSTSARLAKA